MNLTDNEKQYVFLLRTGASNNSDEHFSNRNIRFRNIFRLKRSVRTVRMEQIRGRMNV